MSSLKIFQAESEFSKSKYRYRSGKQLEIKGSNSVQIIGRSEMTSLFSEKKQYCLFFH